MSCAAAPWRSTPLPAASTGERASIKRFAQLSTEEATRHLLEEAARGRFAMPHVEAFLDTVAAVAGALQAAAALSVPRRVIGLTPLVENMIHGGSMRPSDVPTYVEAGAADLGITGKVAIATGGSRGIGRATALTLCRACYEIVVASPELDKNEEVAAEIRACRGDERG